MKEIFTLVAYKPSGSYGGCRKGCCPAETYSENLEIHMFYSLDDLFNKTKELHLTQKDKDKRESLYEFYIFINGINACTFDFSEKDSLGTLSIFCPEDVCNEFIERSNAIYDDMKKRAKEFINEQSKTNKKTNS